MSSIPTAHTILESMAGYSQILAKGASTSANAPIRLAVIDPAYVAYTYPSTLPKVTFEGEDTLTEKRYLCIDRSYFPGPGDRVVMLPVASTYVIAGVVSPAQVAPIYDQQNATGSVTTASTSYASLSGGPSATIDLRQGQKARIAVSCQAFSDTVGANGAVMSWRTTGASGTSTAADDDGHEVGAVNEWTPIYRESIFVATTAGSHVFESRYKAINSTTANFKNRRIIAEAK